MLLLLDLSAAFDIVAHRLLLGRLRDWVGVTGTALAWLASYFSDTCFSVAVGPYRSDSTPLHCGVPQGSVLAPLLFALYMLPLSHIITNFPGISHHCYADDIQLHFSFKPEKIQSLSTLLDCLAAIECWMANNLLQLNTAKTEVLVVSSDSVTARVQEHLGPLKNHIHTNIRNL